MRIVHLIQSAAQIYGAERCVLLETRAQRLRGADVHALLCHETRMGPGAGHLEDELRKLAVPVTRVVATGQVSPRLLYELGRALRRLRPEVLHSHSLKTDVLALPLARLLGIPLVIEVHGYLHPPDDARVRLYERLDQWALRHSDAVLVLSRDYQREVIGYGVAPARVHLVPSGIDVAGLRAERGRRELRAELGLPPRGQGPPVVGMVARLSPEKGHLHFLHALGRLRERGLPVLAVLFGEGPLRAELVRHSAALGSALGRRRGRPAGRCGRPARCRRSRRWPSRPPAPQAPSPQSGSAAAPRTASTTPARPGSRRRPRLRARSRPA